MEIKSRISSILSTGSIGQSAISRSKTAFRASTVPDFVPGGTARFP
jgi:hypothetical protein